MHTVHLGNGHPFVRAPGIAEGPRSVRRRAKQIIRENVLIGEFCAVDLANAVEQLALVGLLTLKAPAPKDRSSGH